MGWRHHAGASVFTGVGILICVLPSEHASAQEPSPDFIAEPAPNDVELEDIDLFELEVPEVMIVTAGRRAQRISQVPYAIGVVTADDIRRSGARSVPDALRLVPGIDIADLSYINSAVSTRGDHALLSNQVLVLVDGRQIFDSVFGGTVWGAWPFQLEDIARIEVIRGPGGVTWGANAVNGVINIITKDPKDQLGLTFTGSGGSRGTHKEHLGYAFGDEKFRLRVSGEYEGSDGFRAVDPWIFQLEDDIQLGKAGVHAVYQPTKNDTFTFSGGHGLSSGGRIAAIMSKGRRETNPVTQASFLLGTWQHAINDTDSFELTTYVNDDHGDMGHQVIQHRYQQIALLASHRFALGEAHTVTWGLDTRTDLIDTSNADPRLLSEDYMSTAIIGVYAQDDWRFAPKWMLSLGARLDYEFYGGFQPSLRTSLSYELNDNAMLYGAVSRAFAMPPAAARFLDAPVLGGLGRITANRDIDAQILWAYELGYRAQFAHRFDVAANVYWHEFDNLTGLWSGLGPPGLMRIEYDNDGRASTYGFELDTKYRVTDTLTLLGHYTHEQYDWRSARHYHERGAIRAPKHKFMIGAR
ncbi:MAG: TonB-dependent receptor, partial [Phycisphaerae bacterium]|nr:TonB-dependent receptor [Phycisphaerae bacterium]